MSDMDESVTYEARLHWILFAQPLALFAAGLAAAAYHNPYAAIVLLGATVVAIGAVYVKFTTTRIVVTDRRIVYRTGLIGRKTIEMNKDKVESIDVAESVVGRLLDFGTVTVKGTGGGIEAIQNVASPFELRRHVASMGKEPSWMPGISEPAKP